VTEHASLILTAVTERLFMAVLCFRVAAYPRYCKLPPFGNCELGFVAFVRPPTRTAGLQHDGRDQCS
jgi:hypothetical protein